MERTFENRAEAGRLLAEKLKHYAGRDDVIVLGLPRGGVPVAYEVAQALRVPLDVFIVRKLGVPGFGTRAAGAIASGEVRVLNEDVVRALPNAGIHRIGHGQGKDRARAPRTNLSQWATPPQFRDRIVILVDDGSPQVQPCARR